MVILDHTLAQQIVDRTMSIIGHNINVMNAAGTIIGSGEAERFTTANNLSLIHI